MPPVYRNSSDRLDAALAHLKAECVRRYIPLDPSVTNIPPGEIRNLPAQSGFVQNLFDRIRIGLSSFRR